MATSSFCKHCGKSFETKLQFCTACGANISESTNIPSGKPVFKVGIIILILCLFLGAYLLYIIKGEKTHILQNQLTETSSAVPEQVDGIKKFEDDILKFSIQYPNDWEVTRPDDSTVVISKSTNAESTVSVQTIPLNKAGGMYENINEVVSDFKKSLSYGAVNVTFIKEGDAELPHNPEKYKGFYFVVTYDYKNSLMKKMQYFIATPDGKAVYTWDYSAPEKQYDENLPDAQRMYESWVIY